MAGIVKRKLDFPSRYVVINPDNILSGPPSPGLKGGLSVAQPFGKSRGRWWRKRPCQHLSRPGK